MPALLVSHYVIFSMLIKRKHWKNQGISGLIKFLFDWLIYFKVIFKSDMVQGFLPQNPGG
jgi:hypothetical protein